MAKTTAEKSKGVRYVQGKGGRKTANASARVLPDKTGIVVNEKDYKAYFTDPKNQTVAGAPLDLLDLRSKMSASVRVYGGGIKAQAEAVRNAIARALVKFDENFRVSLRRAGYMTRDARMVERKKPGLRKARRAPQWAKR